jgi:hypothetical protein
MIRLLVFTGALALAAGAYAADWVDLFDGKTLKGWTVQSGTAAYKAEDGMIIGTAVLGSKNTFLCTEKEYADFILEFEVKDDLELNSGVQIRSQVADKEIVMKIARNGKEIERRFPPGRVNGYQVEISDQGKENSGNIYDEARRGVFLDDFTNKPQARSAFRFGEWNKFRVECRRDSIKTWVNGVACADIKDSMTPRGLIGLQVHEVPANKFKAYQVRFRNLRIQELN